MRSLLLVITTLLNVLSLLVIADTLLSWILSPFHPVREALGRILQPIYGPIRRIIPPLGGMDFTPLVVLLLIQDWGKFSFQRSAKKRCRYERPGF